MNYQQNDIVKSCPKLESGLRLGQEGIHACQLGPFCAPLYWSGEEAGKINITKDMIVEKRKELFEMLNDDHTNIPCKQCHMVVNKKYSDVKFDRLGHIDLAARTICNLKCNFCGYAILDTFSEAKYDSLKILQVFNPGDVEWDSAVDFNGGEPTLLHDLEQYIDYFTSRKIRVFLYTNAVKYSQAVYNGLKSGSIRWIVTSLDAGTPSSFKKIKKSDSFLQVVENLSRYAHAGNQGGGKLAVKYIFCEDNCSDDDVAGFAYAMLAIRPQKIWLTFDFEPLQSLPPDSDDFRGYDYSKHIMAYTKLYRVLKKHGLDAGHFTENHLAAISNHGKILLDWVKSEIKKADENDTEEKTGVKLEDFRVRKTELTIEPTYFSTAPLRKKTHEKESENWSLDGKRVVIAPTCHQSKRLVRDKEISQANIVGFLDRDTVLQGKEIENFKVFGYDSISELNPDVVLVASHIQHRSDIVQQIIKSSKKEVEIAILDE